jgi:hypothetical protein
MRPLCQGGCSSPTRPADRARHLDRQLRLLAALGSGKARPAQLPHHDHVIGELTLEPRGGDEQFRTFSLLRRKSVQYESLGVSGQTLPTFRRLGRDRLQSRLQKCQRVMLDDPSPPKVSANLHSHGQGEYPEIQ